jgi:hypothetical protein
MIITLFSLAVIFCSAIFYKPPTNSVETLLNKIERSKLLRDQISKVIEKRNSSRCSIERDKLDNQLKLLVATLQSIKYID